MGSDLLYEDQGAMFRRVSAVPGTVVLYSPWFRLDHAGLPAKVCGDLVFKESSEVVGHFMSFRLQ